jgi:chromosome segregation ATPase
MLVGRTTVKRRILIATMIVMALLPAAGHAQTEKKDENPTLQQLMRENQNLTQQIDQATKTKGEIAKASLENEGAQAAVKGAFEKLRHSGERLIDDEKNIQEQGRRAGCPWGSTLVNQEAFVAACNKEADRLNGMLAEVQKQAITLQDYARELEGTQTKLSNNTIKLARQKHKIESDLNLLAIARQDWSRRYQEFLFQSPTYNRLRQTAPAARSCESMLPPSGLDETAAHEYLRRTAQCLQWVWDGAR